MDGLLSLKHTQGEPICFFAARQLLKKKTKKGRLAVLLEIDRIGS